MPMPELRGILTAMATPFEENGAVDEDAARELLSRLKGAGLRRPKARPGS